MMSVHSKSGRINCPILLDNPKSGLFQELTNYRHVNMQMYPGLISKLCKMATVAGTEAQGWSLNPGRYVGVAERVDDDGDFLERLEELNEELEQLNAEARVLEERIGENVGKLLS